MDWFNVNNYVKKHNTSKKQPIKKMPKDKDVEDTINSAFVKYINEQLLIEDKLTTEYKKDIKHLIPILNEYLENFIVIGHDILGNEVFLSYNKNQNDKNALNKLFMDVFMKIMSKNDG